MDDMGAAQIFHLRVVCSHGLCVVGPDRAGVHVGVSGTELKQDLEGFRTFQQQAGGVIGRIRVCAE